MGQRLRRFDVDKVKSKNKQRIENHSPIHLPRTVKDDEKNKQKKHGNCVTVEKIRF